MTREQKIVLARLECATDRFVLAHRMRSQPAAGVLGAVLKHAPMIQAGLLVANPFLPRPLRFLGWIFRALPLKRRD